MSVEPTTTEGRVAIGTWAKLGHDIPGHKVLALLDALDEAAEDQKVIRVLRRQRDEAEAALGRVRDLLDRHKSQEIDVNDVYEALEGES